MSARIPPPEFVTLAGEHNLRRAKACVRRAVRPRPVPDRQCPQGILYVLHTGIGRDDLPQELGFGSGMTCWRPIKRWTDAGVFDDLHQILLAQLNAANELDWSRAMIGGSHIDAKKGAPEQVRPTTSNRTHRSPPTSGFTTRVPTDPE